MRFHHLLVMLIFAGCLSGLAAENDGLVIVDAIWKSGTREANVTSKIRGRVRNDSVEFPLTIESLGDPNRGHQKILRITFRYHGVEHTIECAEGRTLRLPPPTADVPDATFGGDQRGQIQRITDATKVVGIPKKGMQIVQAVFGTDGIWRDVTVIVQQGVTEDRWQVDLHFPYTELGGDPAKGKGKHLIIGYRLDGTPKVAIFDELTNRSIPVSLP
jgi:hypothetical protein